MTEKKSIKQKKTDENKNVGENEASREKNKTKKNIFLNRKRQ